MRIQIAVVTAFMTMAMAPTATADPLPVNWWFEPGHIGLWFDGTVTNNHPTDLALDRSGGSNALSWSAPSYTDGRTLVGYTVYRLPSDSTTPVVDFVVTATSFTDTGADFSKGYVYTVTAIFENSGGLRTESVPGEAAPAHPSLDSGYPRCIPVTVDLGQFPYLFPKPGCVLPPPI